MLLLLKNIGNAIIEGLKKSFKLILKLALFIIPVYLVVSILEYTGALSYVAKWFDMVIDWLNYKIKF